MSTILRLALVCPFAIAASVVPAHERPNIVIILADDFGYGDTQVLNSESKIQTPNLNRLAAEGMTFTDAHTPSAVCTPTRYGLVCGRYCWRTRLKRGVLGGYSEPLIDADRQTIADVAKSAGYRTGVVGKWHLGLGWHWNSAVPEDVDNFGKAKQPRNVDYAEPIAHGPFTLGFDQNFLIPASLDMTPYVYVVDNGVEELPTATVASSGFPAFWRGGEAAPNFKFEDVLDRFVTEATSFITETKEKPFFLYMPLSAPHKPVIVHPRFEGQTELGPYGDFIVQTDAAVGAILDALDHHSLAENTVVFFTSDNGSFMYRGGDKNGKDHVDDPTQQRYKPENHTSNGPLRGTKADVYEAGHRVPLLARWPEHIEAGAKSDHTLSLVDLLATVSDLSGGAVQDGMAEDSTSFAPVLLGDGEVDRPKVINHSAAGMFAVRDGQWKLILGNGSGGRENPRGKAFAKPYQLYDLNADLGETKNLIEDHPEVAERLEAAAWEIIGDDAPGAR